MVNNASLVDSLAYLSAFLASLSYIDLFACLAVKTTSYDLLMVSSEHQQIRMPDEMGGGGCYPVSLFIIVHILYYQFIFVLVERLTRFQNIIYDSNARRNGVVCLLAICLFIIVHVLQCRFLFIYLFL